MLLSSISLALTRLGGGGPSLDFQFLSGSLSPQITFTRASTATFFNSSGVLTSASNDVARFDYNPATLAPLGLLIEESRTNSIRNNTMVGAVAGTPGTVPTNWSDIPTSNGLSRQIVGVGTQSGINYIDIRYSGTTTAASSTVLQPEPSTQTVAATGQSWTASAWWALAGGSTSGLTIVQRVTGRSSVGGFLENTDTSVTLTGTLTRYSASRTFTNASTERVSCDFAFSYASGAAIDITLRIGLPQLEQGAFATSVIPTTTTALTRAADVASVNTLTPWFNATEGTIFVEASNAQLGTSLFSTDDGTASNRIVTYFNVANSPAFRVVSGGVDQANFSAGTITQNATFKLSTAYATNDFAASLNGAAAVTDTSGTVPSGQTTARIGSNVSSANFINGYLRRVSFFPRRLANAELQAITA
jgi:hypothetical protein